MKPLALMVTRRCTMSCGHCSVESSPKLRSQPEPELLMQRVEEAAAAGITQLLLTGGEPMIRYELCLRLIERSRELGMISLMVSNGFWGKHLAEAERQLSGLVRAGLSRLNLSYDRYHHEFQGAQPLRNIVKAAQQLDFCIDIVVTRDRDDADLEDFVEPFRGAANVQFRFYDLQAVGAARRLTLERMRGELDGHCSACNFPALTDDGRLTACNGPAYFTSKDSPLVVGDLAQQPLADLLEQHRRDVILETIRTQGPRELERQLRQLPGFDKYPFKTSYSGACELCIQINSDPRAVVALRQHLDQEDSRATREAIRQVTARSLRSGRFNRDTVNTSGIVDLLLQLRTQPDLKRVESILGRADLDWHNLLERVELAGLAGPLLGLECHWQRWAPRFFLEGLQEQAAQAERRAQLQQQTLCQLDQALQAKGQVGVLLGGCGLSQAPGLQPRAYERIRVWLRNSDAVRKLDLTAEAHPLPGYWRLPEQAMWSTARSLPHFSSLRVLSPEAQFLLTACECSLRLFSNGLQTAWDLQTVGRVDPQVLLDWVAQSSAPSACWVPLQQIKKQLSLDWLPDVPALTGRRQTFLIRAARSQLFARRIHPQASDPWVRLACWLLLQERPADQLRCLLASLPAVLSRSPVRMLALARAKLWT